MSWTINLWIFLRCLHRYNISASPVTEVKIYYFVQKKVENKTIILVANYLFQLKVFITIKHREFNPQRGIAEIQVLTNYLFCKFQIYLKFGSNREKKLFLITKSFATKTWQFTI